MRPRLVAVAGLIAWACASSRPLDFKARREAARELVGCYTGNDPESHFELSDQPAAQVVDQRFVRAFQKDGRGPNLEEEFAVIGSRASYWRPTGENKLIISYFGSTAGTTWELELEDNVLSGKEINWTDVVGAGAQDPIHEVSYRRVPCQSDPR